MIIFIAGCPLSGKTSYIRDKKDDRDVVIDFDYLYAALTLNELYDKPMFLYRHVESFRTDLLHYFKRRDLRVFVPVSYNRQVTLSSIVERYDAELKIIKCTYGTALKRLHKDDSRKNKQNWEKVIKNWFETQDIYKDNVQIGTYI